MKKRRMTTSGKPTVRRRPSTVSTKNIDAVINPLIGRSNIRLEISGYSKATYQPVAKPTRAASASYQGSALRSVPRLAGQCRNTSARPVPNVAARNCSGKKSSPTARYRSTAQRSEPRAMAIASTGLKMRTAGETGSAPSAGGGSVTGDPVQSNPDRDLHLLAFPDPHFPEELDRGGMVLEPLVLDGH